MWKFFPDIKDLLNHLKLDHNITIKNYYDTYIKTESDNKCLVCNKETKWCATYRCYRLFCSQTCCNNDTYFSSSWELAYYIWLKDHNIEFEYQPKTYFLYNYLNIEHKYCPDFKINDRIIEIKGLQFFENHDPTKRMICPYDRTQDDLYEAKQQCMIENNVEIITDCSEYINYINTIYGKDFIEKFRSNKHVSE